MCWLHVVEHQRKRLGDVCSTTSHRTQPFTESATSPLIRSSFFVGTSHHSLSYRVGQKRDHSVFSRISKNQTVNDGVAHSKNPRKCAYHVTFDLDIDLEHTLDVGLPGVHRVQVWWRSGQLSARRSVLRKSLQTDRRRTPRHCISSFLA